jgi:hypothetical protein
MRDKPLLAATALLASRSDSRSAHPPPRPRRGPRRTRSYRAVVPTNTTIWDFTTAAISE